MIISRTNQFKKDYKTIIKRRKNLKKLEEILILLVRQEEIPTKYHLHALSGNWKGFFELHIEPDWLLIFKIMPDEIILTRTGTHSDLYG